MAGIYGSSVLNEEVIIKNEIDKMDKKDLSDKDKVEEKINSKKSDHTKLYTALIMIGVILLAIPVAVASPIIISVMSIIKNIRNKFIMSYKEKETKKIIESYKNNINKLQKQLEKETDNKNKAEIKKLINKFEQDIDNFEKSKEIEKFESKYYDEIKRIKNIINIDKEKNKYIPEDIDDLSLFIFYFDLNTSSFEKYIKSIYSLEEIDSVIYKDDEYHKKLYDFIIKNFNNKDKIYIIEAIDDTFLAYSPFAHKFVYSDSYRKEYTEFYTVEELKQKCKIINSSDWEALVEVDKYLGYYKLSNPPQGIEIKNINKII